MAQQGKNVPLQIQYGHTDDRVIMVFSQHVQQVGLSPAELDAMVRELQDMKAKLADHQAGKNQRPPDARLAS